MQSKEQFQEVYNTPGRRFTAGGDYNAKHTDRLGMQTHYAQRTTTMTTQNDEKKKNLKHLSTGEPKFCNP
jgi:hypothetical protein